MATRTVATVFGGSGFIGRYVVTRLAHKGFVVRVAVRDPEAALFLKTAGAVGQIVPLYAPLPNPAEVGSAVNGASLVINLAGILTERRSGDFQRVHTEGAATIARLAGEAGVERLVHVSAIGADPASASRYGASKGAGEQMVQAAFPEATILRPSIVFGPEDHFFNRFAALARISPVMPVIAGATRMQPVYVGDVADAIMAALAANEPAGQLYELGGPQVWSFHDILAYVLQQTGRPRLLMRVPTWLARLQATILERLPGKLLTSDQLVMLARDNIVADGAAGLTDLGIIPTPMELVVPGYLQRFQPGGGRRPFVPSEPTDGPIANERSA